MIKRRLDQTSPQCDASAGCPAIFELENGNFAFIGEESTETLLPHLPQGSGCAQSERIITVPRETVLAALQERM